LKYKKIVLPKSQTGNAPTKQGLGYFAFSKDNQLYILYNE